MKIMQKQRCRLDFGERDSQAHTHIQNLTLNAVVAINSMMASVDTPWSMILLVRIDGVAFSPSFLLQPSLISHNSPETVFPMKPTAEPAFLGPKGVTF